MAKDTGQVNINIINEAHSVDSPPTGIVYVLGETLFGIPNNPEDLVKSWTQFEKLYGGLLATNDFPLQCKLALQAGAILRVCRVMGVGAAAAVTTPFADDSTSLFALRSKAMGSYYNTHDIGGDTYGLHALTLPPTNGEAHYFNLRIDEFTSGRTELYENILIDESGQSPGTYTYLSEVVGNSQLVDVLYSDISGATGLLNPPAGPKGFMTGSDGATPTITDYTGSPGAKTGIYSFDNYDDGTILAVPSHTETSLAGL